MTKRRYPKKKRLKDRSYRFESRDARNFLSLTWEKIGEKPEIIFDQNGIIAVNKPSGISVEPSEKEPYKNTQTALKKFLFDKGIHLTRLTLFPIHRIDKGTSGVVLFSTKKTVAVELYKQFEEAKVKRMYVALVDGHITPPEGTLVDYLESSKKSIHQIVTTAESGKKAILHYKTLKLLSTPHSLVQVELKTGRNHQIRVQLAHLGFPIVGDWLYGLQNTDEETPFTRMCLHAEEVEFIDPTTQENVHLKVPLPFLFGEFNEEDESDF